MILPRQLRWLMNSLSLTQRSCSVAGAAVASGVSNIFITGAIMVIFMGCLCSGIMALASGPAVPVTPFWATNRLTVPMYQIRVIATWKWPEDTNGIVGFVVRHGVKSENYYEAFACGMVTNLAITFAKQIGAKDYFLVEAVSDGSRLFEPSDEYLFTAPVLKLIGFVIDCGQPSMGEVQRSVNGGAFVTFTNRDFDRSVYVPWTTNNTLYRTKNAGGIPQTLTISNIYAPL
jgi:hypothetical protein